MSPRSDSDVTLGLVSASEADLALIAGIVNRAFHTHALMNGRDRTHLAGLLEESGPDGAFILASVNGSVVATAMVRSVLADFDGAPGYTPTATALYFGLAAVEPTRMRSGLGRALVAEAERIALQGGFTHVALSTLYEFGLVPYYTRQGFTPMADETFDAGHWGLQEIHTLVTWRKRCERPHTSACHAGRRCRTLFPH